LPLSPVVRPAAGAPSAREEAQAEGRSNGDGEARHHVSRALSPRPRNLSLGIILFIKVASRLVRAAAHPKPEVLRAEG